MTKANRIYTGIDHPNHQFEKAAIALQPMHYDGTSTWGKGANLGFDAFMEASDNMEIYDIETDSEVYRRGIYIMESLPKASTPKENYLACKSRTKEILQLKKFPTFFGGEHSVSIGIIEAMAEHHKNLSVLQLDAHADLRPEYEGSPYNHACALHWASQNLPLVQVGIRSMDTVELDYLKRDHCFFAQDICGHKNWHQQAIDLLSDDVYLTIDLDVFDPSIMPATGTPEPGGLLWNETLEFLKKVFLQKNIVGFDIVELAPIPERKDAQFLAAKLFYKLLSYKFEI